MLPLCFCIDYWWQINLHQQDLIKMWCSDSPKYLLKYNIRDSFDSLEDYRDCCGEKRKFRGFCVNTVNSEQQLQQPKIWPIQLRPQTSPTSTGFHTTWSPMSVVQLVVFNISNDPPSGPHRSLSLKSPGCDHQAVLYCLFFACFFH